MQFEDVLRNIIEEECEDYYMGVADLSQTQESLIEKYGSLIEEYPQAISIGITLPQMKWEKFSEDEEEFYMVTNRKLDLINLKISSFLQKRGYRTFSVPKLQNGKIFHYLHKLAANNAGLGTIGENGLLITPEMASKVILCTLLTNAPFK